MSQETQYYRGYTIEPTSNGCPYGGYDYYPTEEGRNEDYDWTGDGWQNCGNVGFASSIEDAKDAIWEKVMTSLPQHKVVLNKKDYYFDWIEDAIKFAVMWNAEEFVPGVRV